MSLEGPLQPHHELVTGCYLWEVGNLKLQRAFGELNDVEGVKFAMNYWFT